MRVGTRPLIWRVWIATSAITSTTAKNATRQARMAGLFARFETPSGEIRTRRRPHADASMPVTNVAAHTARMPHHGSSISAGRTVIACIVSRPHAGSVAK